MWLNIKSRLKSPYLKSKEKPPAFEVVNELLKTKKSADGLLYETIVNVQTFFKCLPQLNLAGYN